MDCDPRFNMTVNLYNIRYFGINNLTLSLDPDMVTNWICNDGKKNYGLLMRAVGGTLSIPTKFTNSSVLKKAPVGPSLKLTFDDSGVVDT